MPCRQKEYFCEKAFIYQEVGTVGAKIFGMKYVVIPFRVYQDQMTHTTLEVEGDGRVESNKKDSSEEDKVEIIVTPIPTGDKS